MSIQTATLGDLEHAQNIVIAQCLFTAEHNAPCPALVTKYTLGKGQKSLTVPKVGQATAVELTDGVDMVNDQDIDLSYEEATPNEVGLKFILTDKLIRQFNEDVFGVIGNQMGDGMARKRDKDVIALFSGLDNTWGGTPVLTAAMAFGFVTLATSYKFTPPVFVVHHPNTLGSLTKGVGAIGSTYYAGLIPGEHTELITRNFWMLNLNGVNFFHDGNIEVVSGQTYGYGAIFSKIAMGVVESLAPTTERERDASLRAWEVVMVSDYKAFEVDGRYGGRLSYSIANLATT